MIQEQTEHTAVCDAEEEIQCGIDNEGMAHIISLLRDLYNDIHGGVVREILMNSKDANIEAENHHLPVIITLPSVFSPQIEFRDFGPGLSHERIVKIFSNYGGSTKRDTQNQIGMFGIGSKSPLAYGDSYIIESFRDGVKTTYSNYIDETLRGKIAKMGEEPTNEPNGLNVIVPVKEEDIVTFKNRVVYFSRFFDFPLEFVGEQPEIEKWNHIMEGENWYITEKSNLSGMLAVMGGVPYRIDPEKLNIRNIPGLVMMFPIGAFHIPPAREEVKYTNKTIQTITSKFNEVKDFIQSQMDKDFAECQTLFEAKQRYSELTSADLLRYFGFQPKWRGKTVTQNFVFQNSSRFRNSFRLLNIEDGVLNKLSKIPSYSWRTEFSPKPKTKYAFLINTGQIGTKLSEKVNYLVNNGFDIVIYIRVEEKTKQVFKEFGKLPDGAVFKFDDCITLPLPKNTRPSNFVRTKKNEARVWSGRDYYDRARSYFQKIKKVDLEKDNRIYLVYTDTNNTRQYHHAYFIKQYYSNLSKNIEILGVKKTQLSKLGKGWVHVTDLYNKLKENAENKVSGYRGYHTYKEVNRHLGPEEEFIHNLCQTPKYVWLKKQLQHNFSDNELKQISATVRCFNLELCDMELYEELKTELQKEYLDLLAKHPYLEAITNRDKVKELVTSLWKKENNI